MFYTLAFSLPLLGSLLLLSHKKGRLIIVLREAINWKGRLTILWYFATVWAFLVKLPIYGPHLWLPKAHVEPPVAGSIILAGVLLELGGYGIIRSLIFFQVIARKLCWLWVRLSLWGGVSIRLMCLRQVDVKSLIAYSSVAHIRLVLCSLIIYNFLGVIFF